jgi:multiple sugar transport system permease protein
MSLSLTQQKKRKTTYSYLALIPFLVFFLFPLYWMLLTSFKQDSEITSLKGIPLILNSAPTLDHYKFILFETRYIQWFWNSFQIAAVVTIITMVVSVLGAYAISRLRFFGSRHFGVGIFCTYLVPPALLFIPFYKVVGLLGLLNTKWCLLFLYPTLTVPFCTWILIGYFTAIPKALDEAAFVDGATYIQMLTRVFLPVAAPGLIAATLFAFRKSVDEWNLHHPDQRRRLFLGRTHGRGFVGVSAGGHPIRLSDGLLYRWSDEGVDQINTTTFRTGFDWEVNSGEGNLGECL